MFRSRCSRRRRDRGFTLIEVLMVLAILVIIAGLAAGNLFGLFASGKVRAAKVQASLIADALEWYKLEMGQYPQSLEVLTTPAQTSDGRPLGGTWIDAKQLMSPWSGPFQFVFPSQHGSNKCDVWCMDETGNPVGNW